jgi:hypothetical protein
LECFDAWRHVFELAPPKQGKLRERKDALPLLGQDDDLALALLKELPPPPPPAHRLTPRSLWVAQQPVGRRQGKHQPGEHPMHPHRTPRILRRMAQIIRLIGCLDAAGFDEAALIIGLERLPGLVHRAICRKDRLPPGALRMTVPAADDHRMDGIGLEAPGGW